MELSAGNHSDVHDICQNNHSDCGNRGASVQCTWSQKMKKFTQADGLKSQNALQNKYGDMSNDIDRLKSFKNFPHKALIMKLCQNGYFFSGSEDTAICHKCHATVSAWKENDDPAIYHESDCPIRINKEKLRVAAKPSPGGNTSTSLMDLPIAESPDVLHRSAILQPTPISLTVGMPTDSKRLKTVPPITIDGFRSMSMPPVAQGTGMQLSETTDYDEKGIKIGRIFSKEHKDIVMGMDLFKEEERRKTFLFRNSWSLNTNNVLPYKELAAEGFFYLGNIDRTQCFSCGKILSTWVRKDKNKVNEIHRKNVPNCRMAQGSDARNVPITTIKHGVFEQPSTSHQSMPYTSQQHPSSVESTLEISAPNYTTQAERHNHIIHRQDAHSQETCLSDPSPNSIQVSENFGSNLERASSMIQGNQSAGLHYSFQGTVLPTPIDEASGRSVNLPSYEQSNIRNSNNPPKIKLDHFSIPVSDELQANSTALTQTTSMLPGLQGNLSNFPAQPSTVDPLSVTQSRENAIHVTPTTQPSAEQPQAMELQGDWADAFPCDDPEHPEMRSVVDRRETFNFRWVDRDFSNVDEMARAGFYCFDENRVRCWYCGCSQQRWTPEDNPWEVHALICANCEYLLQHKGLDFVTDICSRRPARPASPRPPSPPAQPQFFRRYSISSNSSDESPYSSVEVYRVGGSPRPNVTVFGHGGPFISYRGRDQGPPKVVDPREEQAKHKRMLDTSLNSEMTMAALEMGFEIPIIKKVIKRKIRNTDETYPSASALLDDLLCPPADLSDSSDSDSEDEDVPHTQEPSGSRVTSLEGSGAQGGGSESNSLNPSDVEPLDEKTANERMREFEHEKRCKVCLDRDAEVVFIPCGHLCTCVECAGALRTCPLCRKRIQKSLKTYVS